MWQCNRIIGCSIVERCSIAARRESGVDLRDQAVEELRVDCLGERVAVLVGGRHREVLLDKLLARLDLPLAERLVENTWGRGDSQRSALLFSIMAGGTRGGSAEGCMQRGLKPRAQECRGVLTLLQPQHGLARRESAARRGDDGGCVGLGGVEGDRAEVQHP